MCLKITNRTIRIELQIYQVRSVFRLCLLLTFAEPDGNYKIQIEVLLQQMIGSIGSWCGVFSWHLVNIVSMEGKLVLVLFLGLNGLF